MKKSTIITLIVTGIILISGFGIFSAYKSTFDKNVQLKNEFKAQYGAIEANYSKFTSVLRDQAKLVKLTAEQQREFYNGVMSGKYNTGDGSLMKMIVSQDPKFDMANSHKLMNNIEALRTDFEGKQVRILAIQEQHNNLRQEFWSRFFLGDEPELAYKMISTSEAKKTIETGIDESDMYSEAKK